MNRLNRVMLSCAISLLGFIVVSPANAQSFKKGVLSGVIASASVLAAGSTSTAIMTTPAAGGGVFILTQFCQNNNNLQLSSVSLGPIATPVNGASGGGNCVTLAPGFAFPPGDVISCVNGGGGPLPCSITGVISKN